MNKKLLAAMVAGCAMFSGAALADDGQVKFTGNIIDTGCEVVNNMDNRLEVPMGDIAKTVFTGVGSTAAEQRFAIKLKNCPNTATKAAVIFSGENVGGDNSKLQLTGEGTPGVASGVALQLVDGSNNAALQLHSRSASLDIPQGTDNIDLPFRVRYIQIGSSVAAGTADGVANFTISYN